jgi:DNA helicase II / ATP-dependent DNA helicase PcrA
MTRARQELHLVTPVRFYVTQQSPGGDRYVHGAHSRFLTEAVVGKFDRSAWPESPVVEPVPAAPAGASIDVASRLREMW